MKRPASLRHLLLALPLLAALSVSMTGCTPHGERERLQRVAALVETDVPAACALLDSVDVAALRGDQRARYALLRTQADYKAYVPLTSDSLIRIATRRYGTRRPSADAALAQYYLGCTYKDMGRDLDAIDAFLRATSLFPDTTNKYYAFSQFELGRLYSSHLMLTPAQDALKNYKNYASLSNDSLEMSYADYYLGMVYVSKGDSEKGRASYRSLLANGKASINEKGFALFQLSKIALLYDKDYDLAMDYIDQYFALSDNLGNFGSALSIKGQIYENMQKYDSAYHYFQLSLQSNSEDIYTKCSNYKHLNYIASKLNRYDSVYDYTERYTVLLDSVYARTHRSEIKELMANHTIELHDREMAERHSRLLWFLGLVGLVLTAAAVISVLAVKRRQQAEKLAYQEEMAALRREQISQRVQEDEPLDSADAYIADADCEAVPAATAAVLPPMSQDMAYLARIVDLVRKNYAESDWPKFFVTNQAHIQRGEFMRDDKAMAFQKDLDDLFAEVFMHIVFDQAGFSQADLRYCAMAILRMNVDQMAFVTHSTKHSFYCRHAKMRDRLTDDWYALVFGKPKK